MANKKTISGILANDGSPYVYYLDGHINNSTLVFYIEGGTYAFLHNPYFNAFNLRGRAASLTSSTGYGDTLDLSATYGGFLEENVTNFLDGAVKGYMPYLSSDFFRGSAGTSVNYRERGTLGKYYFQGSLALERLTKRIAELPSILSNNTTDILIVGAKSAATGLLFHWPFIFNYIKSKTGIATKGVVETGVIPSITPYYHMRNGNSLQLRYADFLWGQDDIRTPRTLLTARARLTSEQKRNLLIMQTLEAPTFFGFFGIIGAPSAAWLTKHSTAVEEEVKSLGDDINWWLPPTAEEDLLTTEYNTVLLSGQTPADALESFYNGNVVQDPA